MWQTNVGDITYRDPKQIIGGHVPQLPSFGAYALGGHNVRSFVHLSVTFCCETWEQKFAQRLNLIDVFSVAVVISSAI